MIDEIHEDITAFKCDEYDNIVNQGAIKNRMILKVLQIDDDINVCEVLKSGIEIFGHECVSYQNPLKAVTGFSQKEFDLVITDFNMPGMNGLEVLKAIKCINPDTPVVILSGSNIFSLSSRGEDSGIYCLLQKPVELYEIRDVLNEIELKNVISKDNRTLQALTKTDSNILKRIN